MTITKEDTSKIKSILETLEKDPRSVDFLAPVDHVAWGLTDYLTIVKTPMDLGTIKKNFKASKYNSSDEIFDDVQLVWANCKSYNQEGSEIWKLAAALEKVTNKLRAKHFKSTTDNKKKENSNVDDNKEENDVENEQLNLQEKIQLTDRVRKLSNEGLAAFVRAVQKECPSAFEDLDSERVQVRVDNLNKEVLAELNKLLDSYLKK